MTFEKILGSVRTIIGRPDCRETIVRLGLLPDILKDGRSRLWWDGNAARLADGSRYFYGSGTPTRLHLELKLMAVEGVWGDLRSVTLSWHRYSLLRDQIDGKIRGAVMGATLWWPANHVNGDRRNRR